jgi:hypothetical protein
MMANFLESVKFLEFLYDGSKFGTESQTAFREVLIHSDFCDDMLIAPRINL